jgi:hypothetical protein
MAASKNTAVVRALPEHDLLAIHQRYSDLLYELRRAEHLLQLYQVLFRPGDPELESATERTLAIRAELAKLPSTLD